MEEPRVSEAVGQDEPKRVELVWAGKRREVDRIVLPFQSIEIVNESRATREADKVRPLIKGQRSQESSGWRNKLVWGDNKYVLGSLLEEFAGKIDLIYIDPPFGTGQDFSFQVDVGEERVTKEASLIEEKAYRDTWGRGLHSYLSMLYERFAMMRELLSPHGSLYVHIGPNVSYFVRAILVELFGDTTQGNIIWQRTSSHGDSKWWGVIHDEILFFTKTSAFTWNAPKRPFTQEYIESHYSQVEERTGRRFSASSLTAAGTRRGETGKPWRGFDPNTIGRHWGKLPTELDRMDKEGRIYWPTKEGGWPREKLYLDERDGRAVGNIWDDIPPINSQAKEDTGYDTQKPESLLERIVRASSNDGDLVADFFCGSGTSLAIAEKLGRRWIGCDLGRFAINVTRKRLLEIEGCRPFEVLNLGKYERQYWQGATFGGRKDCVEQALHEYVKFILDLYHAEPTAGLVHIHGQRGGRMVHIGAADAPVTLAEIREAMEECRKIQQTKLDVLGWEWEMGLHDVIEAESRRTGVNLRLLNIPREAMDRRAVDAGDVHFYELAYLEVEAETKPKKARLKLKNFVIPSPELIPDDVRKKIKKWSDFIDYWSVDFEFNEDVFHNQWQDYRTRAKRDLATTSDWHEYSSSGKHKVLVKVFDVFGNDTTHLLEVRV